MQVKSVWHQADKNKSDINAVLHSTLVWIQVDMISLFMALNLYKITVKAASQNYNTVTQIVFKKMFPWTSRYEKFFFVARHTLFTLSNQYHYGTFH